MSHTLFLVFTADPNILYISGHVLVNPSKTEEEESWLQVGKHVVLILLDGLCHQCPKNDLQGGPDAWVNIDDHIRQLSDIGLGAKK